MRLRKEKNQITSWCLSQTLSVFALLLLLRLDDGTKASIFGYKINNLKKS